MTATSTSILVLSFAVSMAARASDHLVAVLESRGAEIVREIRAAGVHDGKEAYLRFVDQVGKELAKAGDRATAARITTAMIDPGVSGFPRSEFAWVTHTFAREFYQDSIIRETAELIKFRTYATEVPNRLNPEFVRQKEYLRGLARKLELNFKDVDGFVQEVWIGEGKESFGIMSHSDVQPVDSTEWSHDPWSGEISEGRIWGRGSVDDKGPIVAVMYGMRALLDSGLPLTKRIVLLIGTDEESANEDISTYLKTHKAPDQTIVVDSNYPVICAEKGWGGVWLTLWRGRHIPPGPGVLITGIQSGFSPSIVPEKATAKLVAIGISSEQTKQMVGSQAMEFMKKRKGSRISVGMAHDTIVVTALGKSVHSSVPATGHNALMDLLVFLDRDIKPLTNEMALMAKFGAKYIGFELEGKSLGIAHRDAFMGKVTVAADMFETTDSTAMFMFNFRIPRGISRETIEKAIGSRFDSFAKAHGVRFTDRRYIGEPQYTDPESPFVQRLLTIYNAITKESRKAQSIGGGTYAQRIPNALVFGPALPDEEYLGHRPDEHFRISTLVRNIEILTHTMVEFGM